MRQAGSAVITLATSPPHVAPEGEGNVTIVQDFDHKGHPTQTPTKQKRSALTKGQLLHCPKKNEFLVKLPIWEVFYQCPN